MPVPIEIAETIFRKKSKYGRYIDTKQWNKFGEVALPNAELSFFGSDGSVLVAGKTALVFSSSQAFTTFFGKFFANAQTLHMFGPGELEQIKTDEVKATWGMEDQIILNGTGGLVEMRGGGYYYETWKMHGDDWFLASLRLERTYQKTSLIAKVFIFLERYSGLTFI
jgi:hypothetical protein